MMTASARTVAYSRLRRALVAFAATWGVVGGAFAWAVLLSADIDAGAGLVVVAAASIFGPVAAMLGAWLLARHRDRLAGLALVVLAGTPTYMAYVLNIPALVVGVALLVRPRR